MEKSWNVLQTLRKQFDFVLIGGWAVYLWAKAQKSRDIDIIIDFATLEKWKQQFSLRKNDRLKKYELVIEEIDIDIYVPHYSKLPIPLENMRTTSIEGFTVASLEELLILKQAAFLERKASEKGEKDKIDILSLLFFCDIDAKRYKQLLEQNNLQHFLPELVRLIKQFQAYHYLTSNPREYKLRQQALLEKLQQ